MFTEAKQAFVLNSSITDCSINFVKHRKSFDVNWNLINIGLRIKTTLRHLLDIHKPITARSIAFKYKLFLWDVSVTIFINMLIILSFPSTNFYLVTVFLKMGSSGGRFEIGTHSHTRDKWEEWKYWSFLRKNTSIIIGHNIKATNMFRLQDIWSHFDQICMSEKHFYIIEKFWKKKHLQWRHGAKRYSVATL